MDRVSGQGLDRGWTEVGQGVGQGLDRVSEQGLNKHGQGLDRGWTRVAQGVGQGVEQGLDRV